MSEPTPPPNPGPSSSTAYSAIPIPQMLQQALEAAANQAAAPALNSAQRRREEKYRKKDPRSWDNVNKSLSGLSEADKFAGLAEKYKILYEEFRKLHHENSHLEISLKTANNDKASLQADLHKAVEGKNKMESLCRELQKKYRDAKDLTIMQLKAEEDRRRALSSQFNERLAEITRLMDEANSKSSEMRNENALMQSRVAELTNQFMDRDKGISQMVNEMDAQRQLHDAKLKKMKMEIDEERHIFEEERMKLEARLRRSEETAKVLQDSNQNLQSHINLYKSQYTEFEETINKSNKMFTNFKDEIAKVTKRNIELESEIQEWQLRVKNCTLKILDEAEKFEKQSRDLEDAKRTSEMLKKLSRRLQDERQQYLQLLKNHNIDILEVPLDDDLKQSTSFETLIPPIPAENNEKQQTLDELKSDLIELQRLTDLSKLAQANRLKQDQARVVNPSAVTKGKDKKKGKAETKKDGEENTEIIEDEDSTVIDMQPSTGAIKKKRNRNRKSRKTVDIMELAPTAHNLSGQMDSAGRIIVPAMESIEEPPEKSIDDFEGREPLELLLDPEIPENDGSAKVLAIETMFGKISIITSEDKKGPPEEVGQAAEKDDPIPEIGQVNGDKVNGATTAVNGGGQPQEK